MSLDLDKFSALIAVGGDGTIHEVVNGMLHREDKKKVPVGFIPNGSGNDMCHALSIESLDHSLDYIIKGNLIKIDIAKVLIDYETEEEIPKDGKLKFMRYSLLGTGYGLVGAVT